MIIFPRNLKPASFSFSFYLLYSFKKPSKRNVVLYSDCQNNVPIGARSNCLSMGACANRRKFVTGLRGRPQIDNKDCTGGYYKQLREKNLFGAVRIPCSGKKAVYDR